MADPMDSMRKWFPLLRGLVPSVFSVFIYGGWAWWANRHHGASVARWAALTQAAVSFSSTLLTSMVMEMAAMRTGSRSSRFVASSSMGFIVGTGLVVAAHVVMQTPELWVTIAPSVLAGVAYAIIYAAVLVHSTS